MRQTFQFTLRNFDHYFATYLYKHKELALTGLGVFHLSDKYVLPENVTSNFFYPDDAISFQSDKSAQITTDFLEEMVKTLGKTKPLVAADIDQYTDYIKQYINLGRPYVIKPLGNLRKDNSGQYFFTSGGVEVERVDSNYEGDLDRGFISQPSAEMKKRKNVVNSIVWVIVILIFAAAAALTYYYVTKESEDKTTNVDSSVNQQQQAVEQNTATQQQTVVPQTITNDTLRFKAVFEKTKWRDKAYKILNGTQKNGIQSNIDSVQVNDTLKQYRIFVYKKSTLADTASGRAVLSNYFGRNVKLEQVE